MFLIIRWISTYSWPPHATQICFCTAYLKKRYFEKGGVDLYILHVSSMHVTQTSFTRTISIRTTTSPVIIITIMPTFTKRKKVCVFFWKNTDSISTASSMRKSILLNALSLFPEFSNESLKRTRGVCPGRFFLSRLIVHPGVMIMMTTTRRYFST